MREFSRNTENESLIFYFSQVKTPNAPAPEESLSLSFDEGSNNFDKNHSQRMRENTKTLAPRFKQTPKPTKPLPNKSGSFKISRQPFKQITPQEQGNSPNSRGKPVLATRNQLSRKGENKENTPLTSRNVLQGNINRKSPGGGTGENTVPFPERNNKIPRSRSVGNHQQKALSDLNSSNPRLPVTDIGERRRHHSEDVQSYRVQQPDELHRTRTNSHSSLALTDDDNLSDISLDSSLTKDNEVRRLSNQSPINLNQSNQPSANHSPKPLPSNAKYLSKQPVDRPYSDRVTDQPSKSDACNLNHQSPRGNVNSRNQSKADTRQNSPKVFGNVRQTSPSPQPDNHQISLISDNPRKHNLNYKNLQPTNPDIHQCARTTSDSKGRRSSAGRSPQPCNRDTTQRRLSAVDMRQPSRTHSDNGTAVVEHDHSQLGNNLMQGDSSHSYHTSSNMPRVPKDIVSMPTYQPPNNHPHQQTMFAKSGDMTNQRVDTNAQASDTNASDMMKASASDSGDTVQQSSEIFTGMNTNSESSTKRNNQKLSPKRPNSAASYHSESDKNSRNFIPQQSTIICNDTPHQISSNHGSNDSLQQPARRVVNEQQKIEEKLASNKELEEQVKRQEDMIRVLQEQVWLFYFSIGSVQPQ